MKSKGTFAVVGAGLAGLACARTLAAAGASVTVFERQDHPGGRADTLIDGAGPYDHGAQYFTTADERFVAVVDGWRRDGVVEPWRGRIVAFDLGASTDKSARVERLVAVPGMRRLGVQLAQGLDVRYGSGIDRLRHSPAGWYLHEGGPRSDGIGPFDAVLLAVPSEPAAALLGGHTPLAERARSVAWSPCWALAMALGSRSGADFDGAFINDDPILAWAARDSGKPRRGRVDGVAERWVLHARPAWSQRYADMDAEKASRWMARAFSARLRTTLNPVQAHAVKWTHATPLNPLSQVMLWDEQAKLGTAGDWCGGPRIEGAYISGLSLAEAVLA